MRSLIAFVDGGVHHLVGFWGRGTALVAFPEDADELQGLVLLLIWRICDDY